MKSLILLSILAAVILVTVADNQKPHVQTLLYKVPPKQPPKMQRARRSTDDEKKGDNGHFRAEGGAESSGKSRWAHAEGSRKIWGNEHASVYVTGEVQHPARRGDFGGGLGLGVKIPFGR